MEILLGHLIGDYLLQSDWLATNKKNKGLKGLFICGLHCFIWTLSICFLLQEVEATRIVLIFVSHFILDRWNIVKWFLNKTRLMPDADIWKLIIVDNTLHLGLLYAILKAV
jgi:hypothetical protein